MRTFAFQLREALASGLRRDIRDQGNGRFLTLAHDLKAKEWGLSTVDLVNEPISSGELSGQGITVIWPFPQLVYGNGTVLLLDSDRVYSVSPTWTLADITGSISVNADDTWSWDEALDQSGQWVWAAVNESDILWNDPQKSTPIQRVAISVQALVAHNGRFLLGGFSTSDTQKRWTQLPSNAVAWTGVRDRSLTTYFEALGNELELENTWGYLLMPFAGSVRAMKRLGGGIAVYGDDGVAFLQPYNDEKGSGYGVQQVLRSGISDRQAVAGNLTRHIWLDPQGVAWEIRADLQTRRLGYEEFLSDVSSSGNEKAVVYDPAEGDFYFSAGTDSYCLSPNGLTKVTPRMSSLIYLSGQSHSVYNVDSLTKQFQTDAFDLGNRDIKTLKTIQVRGQGMSAATITVQYRYDSDSAFSSATATTARADGMATRPVSGVEFRILVAPTLAANGNIDRVDVQWQQHSKQYLRAQPA